MPVHVMLMAECEQFRAGVPCKIRTAFLGSPNELPEDWERVDGVITCTMCLRAIERSLEDTPKRP